jgi:hypothetical protein
LTSDELELLGARVNDARHLDAFADFVAMTTWDVEQRADGPMMKSAAGSTWRGLSNLMQRRGYRVVRELGAPAATSWAVHLSIIPDLRGTREDVSVSVQRA